MNGTQKVIKNLAIAFGIFLSISIISAILFGILMIGTVITGVNLYYSEKDSVKNTVQITEEIENLKIDLNVSKCNIKIGKEFKVETKAEENTYTIDVKKDTLVIKEKKKSVFRVKNSGITIYIPEELKFNEVEISTGVGETNIEALEVEEFQLDMGVGSVNIGELISKKTTKINGGVGRLEISSRKS